MGERVPLVRTILWRWLLSPRTSWRARRLARASYGNTSFDAAWRHARVRTHPDELPYQQRGHLPDRDPSE
ncbi:hypothetical protein [Streptomyces sp. C10-9-1]|uniref:hypothetical protein n=1 Tax=Streptomyces sp. C10-9-1 TaxID=1859285 RepID=UPI003D70E7D9